MRLGYACVNLTLGRPLRSLRLATLRSRGVPYLQDLVNANLTLLSDILRWNRAQDIALFRLSSDLVPLGSHGEVDLGTLDFALAAEVPALARGMRLSMHPGQYTLLSGRGPVWENCQRDLAYHGALLDRLGIEGEIILHGGGVYGNRAETRERIIAHIAALAPALRRRLRLENDERCWSVADLLPICEQSGLPLVVDNLHHALNGGEQAGGTPFAALPWPRIKATWGGRRPKLHYAEQDPSKRPGAHSAYATATRFRAFMAGVGFEDYDVMLECKAKERAVLRLREEVGDIPVEGGP